MAELLVVLLVVGILGTLVVPQLGIMRYRMDGQARGLMSAMLTAQRTAVKRQHDVVVAFDTVSGWVRIHEDGNRNGVLEDGERTRHVFLMEQVRFGRGAAPARSGAGSAAVTFTELQDGLPMVRFHRSGSASQEGTFYMTSVRSTQGSRHASDARSVHVDRATGRTSWYYYDETEWKQGF